MSAQPCTVVTRTDSGDLRTRHASGACNADPAIDYVFSGACTDTAWTAGIYVTLSPRCEGVAWLWGHHDPDSEEARALLVSFVITNGSKHLVSFTELPPNEEDPKPVRA